MPRKKNKSKDKRSHDKGLWIVAENDWIEVKKHRMSADKIINTPPTVTGTPASEDGEVEILESESFPVFRDDVVDRIKDEFKKIEFTPEKLFPDAEKPDTKLDTLANAILKVASKIPLHKYSRNYVNSNLEVVEEYEKYQVIENEEGEEELELFPYLELTHQIWEQHPDTGKLRVLPRIYYDMWLTDKLYELEPYDDRALFKMKELGEKLDAYPVPILDEDGNPTGKTEIQEVMIFKEGYVASSGSTKQYHAFIIPKWITADDGTEKFIFEMKLSRSLKKYQWAVEMPSEDIEIPEAAEVKAGLVNLGSVESMLTAFAE